MERRKERIAYGRAHGYEIIKDGYALSGPKYYQRFEQVCLEMVDRYGVNQFKIDGTGNADRVFPGSAFDSDFDAAIHLIQVIRQHKPSTFINLTTGTYPSPFWLFYADSIWRGGDDDGFAGVGSSRQQWITYRDEQTYRNTVERGPLFPINSLMLHGHHLCEARPSASAPIPATIFPTRCTTTSPPARSSRRCTSRPRCSAPQTGTRWRTPPIGRGAMRDILVDTHWIGGDPGQLQVYGWAAWSPQGLDRHAAQSIGQAAVLRRSIWSRRCRFRRARRSAAMASDPFGKPGAAPVRLDPHHAEIRLAPFEVRTFESIAGDSESR